MHPSVPDQRPLTHGKAGQPVWRPSVVWEVAGENLEVSMLQAACILWCINNCK